jgi:hypothetical protein
MKKIYSCVCLLLLFSCSKLENYNGVVSTDKSKPGIVTDIKVINFNGGAYITYSLPSSANILYVLADYKVNGTLSRQTKSSYYSDTIVVNGFADSKEYEVTLHVVSRANVMSDAVVAKVYPDTPVYKVIFPTVSVTPDFGGVNIKALNKFKQPVGVILVETDPVTNRYEIRDQYYTKSDTIDYSVRGMDTLPKNFGIYIQDQWGNISDTLKQTISPIFETQLDKNKFFVDRLATDAKIGYGWELPYMWDGNTDGGSTGWHTLPGSTFPITATFGLGVSAKLSRFALWQRTGDYTYSHGNPRDFTIWGSEKDNPADVQLPVTSAQGDMAGDWINMGNYHYPDPPSGARPGAVTEEDKAFAAAGVNFNIPLANPRVKFIRFAVADTWSGGDFAHVIEITFWGNPF